MGTAEKRRGDVVKTKITAPAEGLPGLPPPSDSDTSSGSFSESSLSDSSITTSGSDLSNPRRRSAARRRDSPAHLRWSKPREDGHQGRSRARYEDNQRKYRSPASRSPRRRSPSPRRHSPPPRKIHVSHKRPVSYSRSPSPRDRKRALSDRRGNSKNEGGGFSLKAEAKGEVPAIGGFRGGGKEADAEPAKGGSVSRVVNGKVALVAAPRKGVEKRQGASDGGPDEEPGEERKLDEPDGEENVSKKGAAAEGESTPLAETVVGTVRDEAAEEQELLGGGILDKPSVPRGSVVEGDGAPRGSVSGVPAGTGAPTEEAASKEVEQRGNVRGDSDDVDSDRDDVDSGSDDVDSDVGDWSGEKGRESVELEKAINRSEGQQKRSSRWDRKAPWDGPFPEPSQIAETVIGRVSPDEDRRGFGSGEHRGNDGKGVVEEVGRTDGDGKFDKRRENEEFDREEKREGLGNERKSRWEEHNRYDRREDDRYGTKGELGRPDERRREDWDRRERDGMDRNGTDRNGKDWGRSEQRGGDQFRDDRGRHDAPRSRRGDRFAEERGNERRFEERRFDERRFDDRRQIGRENTRADDRRYGDRGSDRRGYQERGHDSWHADRARPPFREKYGGSRAVEERGVGERGRENPPKTVVPFESDETMQADREERARRPAWGAQRGGGLPQRSEKWGHDKFAEVNQGGFRAVAEEDPDAKIEALLAL